MMLTLVAFQHPPVECLTLHAEGETVSLLIGVELPQVIASSNAE